MIDGLVNYKKTRCKMSLCTKIKRNNQNKHNKVNIFFTDFDPVVAARDSCDSYVVKIPIEVALLLSAIHWRENKYEGPVSSGMPLITDENNKILPAIGPYRDSKVIKSSSETYRWLIKSTGNYDYAIKYGLELTDEYERRYHKLHSTKGTLLWLQQNIPSIPVDSLTKDVGLAMPNKYKDRSNPTLSYKKYLFYEKLYVIKWKHGTKPEWAYAEYWRRTHIP